MQQSEAIQVCLQVQRFPGNAESTKNIGFTPFFLRTLRENHEGLITTILSLSKVFDRLTQCISDFAFVVEELSPDQYCKYAKSLYVRAIMIAQQASE